VILWVSGPSGVGTHIVTCLPRYSYTLSVASDGLFTMTLKPVLLLTSPTMERRGLLTAETFFFMNIG